MTVMLLDRHAATQYHQQPQQPTSALKAPPVPPRVACSPSKAMRYYRLWIYTCNAVLLVSVVGFTVVATKVLVADPKRHLVPGLSLTQPSFLYAYLALLTQSGVLQFIGCLGARQLNERLLNIYWLLILLLLIGDALLGVFWVYKFEKIQEELRPVLRRRLALEYGVDTGFTELWDDVQRQYKCCGVESSHDFRHNATTLTAAAVASSAPEVSSSSTPLPLSVTVLPASCCLDASPSASPSPSPVAAALRHFVFTTSTTASSTMPSSPATTPTPPQPGGGSLRCLNSGPFYRDGCEERLLGWLRQTADVLFVLGYCVIAFLKLCFLGILRYEIREMIQKIKILQGELRAGVFLQESPASAGKTPCHELNNGRLATEQGVNPLAARRLMSPEVVSPSGATLQPGGAPMHHLTPPLHRHPLPPHLAGVMNTDVDSDTNSHCALLIPDDPLKQGGHNNNYALQDFLLKRHHNQM